MKRVALPQILGVRLILLRHDIYTRVRSGATAMNQAQILNTLY